MGIVDDSSKSRIQERRMGTAEEDNSTRMAPSKVNAYKKYPSVSEHDIIASS